MKSRTEKYPTAEDLLYESLCIEEAKQDPLKFAFLYNTYYEKIFRFIYQRVNEKQIAFDLTQQVFVKAMLNLSRYKYRGLRFSSWLYRIARNELNQLFRKNSVERTINVDEADLPFIAEEIQFEIYDEYFPKLTEAIAGLEEDDLLLIEMRFFEKRPFKEIGEILDITENNAKVKLYRILAKLKDIILKKQ